MTIYKRIAKDRRAHAHPCNSKWNSYEYDATGLFVMESAHAPNGTNLAMTLFVKPNEYYTCSYIATYEFQ